MGARHHSLITADEMMAARTRHQHELDDINRQVALLVQQYTHHIQHSLLTLSHTTLLSSSFVGASPTQPSLDDILPPLPEPKRKQLHNNSNTTKQPINSTTATVASTPTNADDGTKEDEDEVERDAYGVLIKRRRSKLPWRSVLELRSWFADHLQAPYPTDAQRDDLAQRTQLTVKQVQNCRTPPTHHNTFGKRLCGWTEGKHLTLFVSVCILWCRVHEYS